MPRPKLNSGSSGYLYFIKVPSGLVKIGRSHNFDKRLSAIQVGCPEEIEWAIGWPGRGREEREWHSAFVAARVRGEWFQATDELLAAIKRGKIRTPIPAGDVDAAYERLFAPKPNRRPSY